MNIISRMLVPAAITAALIASFTGCNHRNNGANDVPDDQTPLVDLDNDGIPNVSDLDNNLTYDFTFFGEQN